MKISINYSVNKKEIPLTLAETRQLAKNVCRGENIRTGTLSIVFVSAEEIEKINIQFLNHHYPTDVMVFLLNNPNEPFEGEIYICPEMAQAQSEEYSVTYREEVMRLIVHGVLHTAGYDDTTDEERKAMIEKGDEYITAFEQKNQRERV